METLSKEQKYAQMRESLNEKQWRQYVAMEAEERGNIAEVAREAKVSENTVRSGMREIAAGDVYQEGERVRKKGGGRKPLVERDSTLLEDLDAILQTSRRSDEQCAVDEQIVVTSGERTGGSWTQHQKVSFGGTAT